MAPVKGLRIDTGLNFTFKPSIGITTKGLSAFQKDIQSFKVPLTDAIQRVIIPSIQRNFDIGGRPEWRELAEYTVEVRGNASPILVRTGRLKRTMARSDIWSIDNQKAALLDLPQAIWYGKLHQAGYGEASKRKSLEDIVRNPSAQTKAYIPARPFVMVHPEDFSKINTVFETWLARQARIRMQQRGR